MSGRLAPHHLPLPFTLPAISQRSARMKKGGLIGVVADAAGILFGIEHGEPGVFLRRPGRLAFERAARIARLRNGSWRIESGHGPNGRAFDDARAAWLGLFDLAIKERPDAAAAIAAARSLEVERLARASALLRRRDVALRRHSWKPLLAAWQTLGRVGPFALRRRLFAIAECGAAFPFGANDGYNRILLNLIDERQDDAHDFGGPGWIRQTHGGRWRVETAWHPHFPIRVGYAGTIAAGVRRLVAEVARGDATLSAHQKLAMLRDAKAVTERIQRGRLTFLERPAATDVQTEWARP